MSSVQYGIIKSLVLPPGIFLVAFIVCLIIYLKNKKLFIFTLTASILFFYLFSTPVFSRYLASVIEKYSVIELELIDKEKSSVIVVLGCSRHSNAPEFSGSDTVSACTLVRLRYAALLQKTTNLPIIVSGGSVFNESLAEADLMRDVLEREFNAEVMLMDNKSRNTLENAREVSNLIKESNFEDVILVTHASHMLRAEYSFNHYDINIIPAPTYFFSTKSNKPYYFDFLPSIKAFHISNIILYEMIGYMWIKL